MKKNVILLVVMIITFCLFACEETINNNTNSGLIINKYYQAINTNNNAIELINISQEDINLNGWKLEIYSNGGEDGYPADYEINLEGLVESQGVFVIAHSDCDNMVLSQKADLKSPKLLYNGNDPIALSKDGELMDIIGHKLVTVNYGKLATLIRKSTTRIARKTYNSYDYMMYMPDVFEYLKSDQLPISTNDQLNEGPLLTDEYRNLSFVDPINKGLGGGGAVEVTLVQVKDGDTADFRAKSGKPFLDNSGNPTDFVTIRYYLVDTRENSPGGVGVQEWGQPASNFMKKILNDAKQNNSKIEVQSAMGAGLKDTYARHLGFVWIDGRLANFMLVRAGLTDIHAEDLPEKVYSMNYSDVSYIGYMMNAYNRAVINEWGIHGETDPMWDYDNSQPMAGAVPFTPDAHASDKIEEE